PVVYDWEFSGGERARGQDAFTDPVQARAMDPARNEGGAAVSGRIELVQPSSKPVPGFKIFLPVYRAGAPTSSAAERQGALRGFVYGTFMAEKLFRGIFGDPRHSPLKRVVYDGGEAKQDRLLYEDMPDDVPQNGAKPKFSSETAVATANHRWTLYCVSLPNFEDVGEHRVPMLVLLSCLA